jgi:hypothetical protein
MRAAGLADVSATIVRGSIRYPSAAAYWDVMVRAGAPMATLRAKLGEDAWQAAADRALAALRSRYGDGEVTPRRGKQAQIGRLGGALRPVP